MSTPKPQPVTVGHPYDLPGDRWQYPIVRGDGRIVFVQADPDGTARVMRGGARGLEQHGDPFATKEAAITAAVSLLGEMP